MTAEPTNLERVEEIRERRNAGVPNFNGADVDALLAAYDAAQERVAAERRRGDEYKNACADFDKLASHAGKHEAENERLKERIAELESGHPRSGGE